MNEDDSAEFVRVPGQPLFTNSTETVMTVPLLKPYTVYNFQIQAVSDVGKSRLSKPSYPAVTQRESESRFSRIIIRSAPPCKTKNVTFFLVSSAVLTLYSPLYLAVTLRE